MKGEGKNRHQAGSAAIAEVTALPVDKLLYTPLVVGAKTGDPQDVHVGALSLNGTLGLAHLLAKAALKMDAAQVAQLKAVTGMKGKEDQASIMAALALLDVETVAGVYGCFIDRKTEWCQKNWDLGEFLKVVEA